MPDTRRAEDFRSARRRMLVFPELAFRAFEGRRLHLVAEPRRGRNRSRARDRSLRARRFTAAAPTEPASRKVCTHKTKPAGAKASRADCSDAGVWQLSCPTRKREFKSVSD
jgi:hypothetical protein